MLKYATIGKKKVVETIGPIERNECLFKEAKESRNKTALVSIQIYERKSSTHI